MANYLTLDRPRSDATQPLPLGHVPGTASNLHSHHKLCSALFSSPQDILTPSHEDEHSFVSIYPPKHRHLTHIILTTPFSIHCPSCPHSVPLAQEQDTVCSPALFLFWLLVTLIFGSASVLDQSVPHHRTLTSHNPPFTLCIPQHTQPSSMCPLSPTEGHSGARGAPPLRSIVCHLSLLTRPGRTAHSCGLAVKS